MISHSHLNIIQVIWA